MSMNIVPLACLLFLVLPLPASLADTSTASEDDLSSATDSQLANIELLLYTGDTLDDYVSVLVGDAKDLLDDMDVSKPTIYWIFGWANSPEAESSTTVVGAYLERGDHNVVVVNWTEIAAELFPFAAASVSSVGKVVAKSVDEMVAAGLNASSIHIVGHSLGAQIAGAIGRDVSITIPRITGLDPAGPGFYFLNEDLASSDAEFVDVIHSDAGLYGTAEKKGTVDFYPNGGTRLQPDCPILSVLLSDDDFCSHWRSWKYYGESVLNETAFIGVSCSSVLLFELGLCSSNQAVVMGFATPTTASGTVYLQTNGATPYGKGVNGETYELF